MTPRGPAVIPLEFISSNSRIGSFKLSRFAFFSPPSIILAHNPDRTVSYLSLSLSEENASFNCWLMALLSLARMREFLFSCRVDDDDDDDEDDECRMNDGIADDDDDGVTNASI